MKQVFLLLFLSISISGTAIEADTTIYSIVDEMPRFPSCEAEKDPRQRKSCADKALLSYLFKHIKYSTIAKEQEITSRIVLTFIVEKDGQLAHIKFLKGLPSQCNVQEVLQQMPSWIPGRHKGKAVRVKYHLPIYICLE